MSLVLACYQTAFCRHLPVGNLSITRTRENLLNRIAARAEIVKFGGKINAAKHNGDTVLHTCHARPRRLAFTWNSVHAGENDSLVTVEFLARGDSTEIVLTHERWPDSALAGHTGGWTDILNGLAQSMGEKAA